ncbi:MucR family transcriptional regulator, partial [Brevundimonas sp.]
MDFRILETHLRGVHEMTGDEYRAKYGLPYGRGLCDAKFS